MLNTSVMITEFVCASQTVRVELVVEMVAAEFVESASRNHRMSVGRVFVSVSLNVMAKTAVKMAAVAYAATVI